MIQFDHIFIYFLLFQVVKNPQVIFHSIFPFDWCWIDFRQMAGPKPLWWTALVLGSGYACRKAQAWTVGFFPNGRLFLGSKKPCFLFTCYEDDGKCEGWSYFHQSTHLGSGAYLFGQVSYSWTARGGNQSAGAGLLVVPEFKLESKMKNLQINWASLYFHWRCLCFLSWNICEYSSTNWIHTFIFTEPCISGNGTSCSRMICPGNQSLSSSHSSTASGHQSRIAVTSEVRTGWGMDGPAVFPCWWLICERVGGWFEQKRLQVSPWNS